MKNRYEIRGETTVIFIERRNGEVYEVLIDTEDLEKVQLPNNRKWYLSKKRSGFYVCNKERVWLPDREKPWEKVIYLHRIVLGEPPNEQLHVDHINHNTLDNRKRNLRWVDHSGNSQNTFVRIDNKTMANGKHKVVLMENIIT
ncbi:HNH endonuclease [Thermoactinomyces daqus]|uniref:HNH endonuclease n=1 Tax=Thermoactinomyces daqus TaxID=1329516 RepID=A0A7W1XA62_9BACL|nr:HNH endonuclease [Thermoactinomyces daqus]MBA4542935.1 HNH endonuclease [Thermoactinomyces daqus]